MPNPRLAVKFRYDNPRVGSPPAYWRYVIEVAVLQGYRGFGRMGADFWSVTVKNSEGKEGQQREDHWVGGQPTMQLQNYVPNLLAAGPDGAIGTVLLETLRESGQEIEARRVIEQGLRSGKLPVDLAERCRKHLAQRQFPIRGTDSPLVTQVEALSEGDWLTRLTRPVHQLAGEVSRS